MSSTSSERSVISLSSRGDTIRSEKPFRTDSIAKRTLSGTRGTFSSSARYSIRSGVSDRKSLASKEHVFLGRDSVERSSTPSDRGSIRSGVSDKKSLASKEDVFLGRDSVERSATRSVVSGNKKLRHMDESTTSSCDGILPGSFFRPPPSPQSSTKGSREATPSHYVTRGSLDVVDKEHETKDTLQSELTRAQEVCASHGMSSLRGWFPKRKYEGAYAKHVVQGGWGFQALYHFSVDY